MRLLGGFAASMGIALNARAVYPAQWAILAAVFLLSVPPPPALARAMSRADGLQ